MKQYICPMHPEVSQPGPGRCPKCGMDLVLEGQGTPAHHDADTAQSYRPLAIIIGLIALMTITVTTRQILDGTASLEVTMSTFMAGFFMVFAGFKLLDLKGFAQGYSTYDLLAKRWFGYGYIYPFLELALGLGYILRLAPMSTNTVAVVLLTFSGLGVARKLLRHEKFQCACLGTFLKMPLTKVTLIEDFGMAAMALIMLWLS